MMIGVVQRKCIYKGRIRVRETKFYEDEAKRIFNTSCPTERQVDAVKLATFGHVFEALSTYGDTNIGIQSAFDRVVRDNLQIFMLKDQKLVNHSELRE